MQGAQLHSTLDPDSKISFSLPLLSPGLVQVPRLNRVFKDRRLSCTKKAPFISVLVLQHGRTSAAINCKDYECLTLSLDKTNSHSELKCTITDVSAVFEYGPLHGQDTPATRYDFVFLELGLQKFTSERKLETAEETGSDRSWLTLCGISRAPFDRVRAG